MEINWSIVGWIAGLVFVYIFGLFEGRGQGYKRRKVEEEQEKKDQPVQSKTVKVDEPGLLRIKNENGLPVLDLDGVRVDGTSLLPDQRKRMIELLNIIRPWLEGKPSPIQPVPASPPPPPPVPVSVKPATSAPSRTPQANTAIKSPTIAKEDRPITAGNSIVGQIDSVLQLRLAGTPLEERGVFLAQSPEGGVMVYVGLNKYMGIDEVPDDEIKAAIRAAITDWENKYTPGI